MHLLFSSLSAWETGPLIRLSSLPFKVPTSQSLLLSFPTPQLYHSGRAITSDFPVFTLAPSSSSSLEALALLLNLLGIPQGFLGLLTQGTLALIPRKFSGGLEVFREGFWPGQFLSREQLVQIIPGTCSGFGGGLCHPTALSFLCWPGGSPNLTQKPHLRFIIPPIPTLHWPASVSRQPITWGQLQALHIVPHTSLNSSLSGLLLSS